MLAQSPLINQRTVQQQAHWWYVANSTTRNSHTNDENGSPLPRPQSCRQVPRYPVVVVPNLGPIRPEARIVVSGLVGELSVEMVQTGVWGVKAWRNVVPKKGPPL